MSSPFIIINEIEELLNDMNDGLTSTLSTINTNVNTIKTDVSAVKSATAVNNTASKTGVLSAKSAYIISLLENSTYGLSAIKNAITSNSGMKLKSVTKSYTGTTEEYTVGLTVLQRGTLFRIIVNGTLTNNLAGSSDYGKVYNFTNKPIYLHPSASSGGFSQYDDYASCYCDEGVLCVQYYPNTDIIDMYNSNYKQNMTVTFYYFE